MAVRRLPLSPQDARAYNTVMTKERLARALGYPYPIPDASYVVNRGDVHALDAGTIDTYRQARTPVLAVGSNQSPMQIARKYPETDWAPIACERCVLDDFDTVYSAHITGYGSIAAALHPSPGTQVTLYVNWLDDAQMERMHTTELGNENYAFAKLHDIAITTELGLKMSDVYFYRSNAGAYSPDGTPIPLAEVPAANRRWLALGQRDIQGRVHALTAPDTVFDAFVLSSIEDTDERRRRTGVMGLHKAAFAHPGLKILKT